jgi:hypothetical protein
MSRQLIRDALEDNPGKFMREAVTLLKTGLQRTGTQHVLSLLVAADRVFDVLCDPALEDAEALEVARSAQRVDGAIDVTIARSLAQTMVTSEGPVGLSQAGRLMEILDGISDGIRILPSLVRLLRHTDERVRSKAVLLIGRGKRSTQWVRERLDESDPRVRANAVEALWGVDTVENRQLLRRMLEDRNNRVAGNAMLGLYRLGECSSIAAILKAAAHDAPVFRCTAAWVMGETGDPRFAGYLAGMMREPNPAVRKRAFAALARVKAFAADALQAPRCPTSGRWLPAEGQASCHRIAVAVSVPPTPDAKPLLPTHFAVYEEGRPVMDYKVIDRPVPEMLAIAFLIPAGASPHAVRWSDHLAALLPAKRPVDLWGSAFFLPEAVGSGSPAGEGNLAYHSTPDAIAGHANRRLTAAECTDVWRTLWAAIRGQGGATGVRQRRVVLFNHGRVAGSAGTELLLSASAAQVSVQVISLCREPALEEFCRKTGGHFALVESPAQIPGILADAHLSLFPRFEIQYPPLVPEARTITLKLRSPAGSGEVTLTVEAAPAESA